MRLGISAVTVLALLSACAPRAVQQPPASAGASAPRRPGPPPTRAVAGLEGVIGRTAAILAAQLGRPALDIREGDGRKLQFEGPACILDAYLYPPARGGEPIVTYVDARLPDGRDMDKASCVAALQAQRRVR